MDCYCIVCFPFSRHFARVARVQQQIHSEQKKGHAEECDSGGYLDLCIDFIFIPFLASLVALNPANSLLPYIINLQPHKPFAFNLD